MKILGYADKFSVTQNDYIEFKISCKDIKTYNAYLLKVIQGDINPEGPGYKETKLKLSTKNKEQHSSTLNFFSLNLVQYCAKPKYFYVFLF